MKAKRHAKIVELINQYEIETQEELAQKLHENNYQVTQATVSRDIRELKLTKVSTGQGKQKYARMPSQEILSEKYNRVLKDGILSMENAQNILVIKTVAGMAMAVAAAVDSLKLHEIVGSIAGDDTIMCAVRGTEEAVLVMKKIEKHRVEKAGI